MKLIEVKELVEYDVSSLFIGEDAGKIQEWLEYKNNELRRVLGLRSDAIQIYKKNRKNMLKFVGVAGVNSVSDYEIEIMPKFLCVGSEWRESLFNMIYIAHSNRICAQYSSRMAKKRMNFYDHIAVMFIDEISTALRQDSIHTYRDIEDSSRFLRGRLLMYAQLANIITDPGTLYYEHDIFDTENEFNYLLKWCTQILASKVNNEDVRTKLRTIEEQLPEGSKAYRIPVDTKLPPQYSHYSKAVEIANNLAAGNSMSFQNAGVKGLAYIVSMEVVFEKFIEKFLKKLKSASYLIESQAQSSMVFAKSEDADMRSYYTVPDNKILINGKGLLLIDAKYKNNFVNQRGKKPVNSDLYQMFASLISHDCRKGILISPCEGSEALYYKHWTICDNGEEYTICSLMVNLSDISTVNKINELKKNILDFIERELKI